MKILQKQTLDNGEEELTSSQADFLASLSPSQVRERERMITVTSGRTCSVQYKKSDPLGLLVKTLLESSRWFSPARRLKWEAKPLFSEKITEKEYCYDKSMLSKPSVKTLSEKDIPSNRCLFRLVPSERPTEETGCGLLPTPIASDIHHAERVKNLKDAGAETMASRKKRKQSPEWPDGLHGFPRNASDAQCSGGRQIHQEIQSEKPDGDSTDRNGSKRIDPNTYCELPLQRMLQGEKGRYKQKIRTESLHSHSNWQNFPTQSPVCRGNDGLPFDVDNLTIPFTKWRQESIKGYGNAIVPQVILEIFKAIEELDN